MRTTTGTVGTTRTTSSTHRPMAAATEVPAPVTP